MTCRILGRQHDRPVPRGGGIAVGPAMLLALLASWRGIDQPVLSLAFTASAFGVVGSGRRHP